MTLIRFRGTELARELESLRLPNHPFHHREHVQAAVHYLRRFGSPDAEPRFVHVLRAFAENLGHGEKFHLTLTLCWLRLVAATLEANVSAHSFDELVSIYPALLDKELPFHYYTRSRLVGAEARSSWIEPDLEPLPACRPHARTTAWD